MVTNIKSEDKQALQQALKDCALYRQFINHLAHVVIDQKDMNEAKSLLASATGREEPSDE